MKRSSLAAARESGGSAGTDCVVTHDRERRGFLKSMAHAVLLVEASGLPCRELLSNRADAAEVPAGLVRVTLADFPALNNVGGSVYVEVAAPPPGIYPIILTRTGADAFAAVSSKCTHSGCVANPATGSEGFVLCTCHGSRYTVQGVVVNGPATRDLTAYPTRQAGRGAVEIEVPGIGLSVAGALVRTTAGNRLRLVFPTVPGLHYEVRQRTALSALATVVPFYLTEAGTASQLGLTGDGSEATLYVETSAAAGFLSVTRY